MEEEDFISKKEKRQEKKRIRQKDRSKYKKSDQKQRKRKESEKIKETLEQSDDLKRGRVTAIQPNVIEVAINLNFGLSRSDSEGIACSLRGTLKKERKKIKNLIAVGDFVRFLDNKDSTAVIVHVEKRTSALTRVAHSVRKEAQIIAANIDQILITTSLVQPPLKPALIDRYIIATVKGNMTPVIVINKSDLLTGKEKKKELKQIVATYESLGITTCLVSATTGAGLLRLKKIMKGRSSAFSGQSGTGKSSLINAMTGLVLNTKEVIDKTGKGRHTTSSAKLIPLKGGGWCIDTPGIRSFGLWELTSEDLAVYFPEISRAGKHCKYPTCTHSHEPKCVVLEEVKKGHISYLRWQSYQKLIQSIS